MNYLVVALFAIVMYEVVSPLLVKIVGCISSYLDVKISSNVVKQHENDLKIKRLQESSCKGSKMPIGFVQPDNSDESELGGN